MHTVWCLVDRFGAMVGAELRVAKRIVQGCTLPEIGANGRAAHALCDALIDGAAAPQLICLLIDRRSVRFAAAIRSAMVTH